MSDDDVPAEDLPSAPYERAMFLQNMLISSATGGSGDAAAYALLRREFLSDPVTQPLLPPYVRSCRELGAFWSVAKGMSSTWEGRRVQIRADFEGLLDHLEVANRSPLDSDAAMTLSAFSSDGVAAIWQKALERRDRDPEGAITAARTLLETVCKHILDAVGEPYDEGADLPALYRSAAKRLNLAPSDHTEDVFRQILGGCISVVSGLGAVRNKISDAHGRGARGVRPAPRHAQFAVNLAAATAMFLIETWQARPTSAAA